MQYDISTLSSYFTLCTKRKWIVPAIADLKLESQKNTTTWINYGKYGSVISMFEALRKRFDDKMSTATFKTSHPGK